MIIKALKLTAILLATTAAASGADIPRLIKALAKVESSGNAAAIGDRGKAYGLLQIHEITVREANRLSGSNYSHCDMFDPVKARQVATIVLGYYSKFIQKSTGRAATDQEMAYIWNGGAAAWRRVTAPQNDTKQKNLEAYWRKVQKAL